MCVCVCVCVCAPPHLIGRNDVLVALVVGAVLGAGGGVRGGAALARALEEVDHRRGAP